MEPLPPVVPSLPKMRSSARGTARATSGQARISDTTPFFSVSVPLKTMVSRERSRSRASGGSSTGL